MTANGQTFPGRSEKLIWQQTVKDIQEKAARSAYDSKESKISRKKKRGAHMIAKSQTYPGRGQKLIRRQTVKLIYRKKLESHMTEKHFVIHVQIILLD